VALIAWIAACCMRGRTAAAFGLLSALAVEGKPAATDSAPEKLASDPRAV